MEHKKYNYPNLPYLFEQVKDAIVQIVAIKDENISTGNGWFYEYHGALYVITVAHVVLIDTVINPSQELICAVNNVNGVVGDNRLFKLILLGVDATSDVAVCIIDSKSVNPPRLGSSKTLNFANSRDAKIGDFCFCAGNPNDADTLSCCSGIIRDNAYAGPNEKFIQEMVTVTLLYYSGDSGCPMLDRDGNVIGIVSFMYINDAVSSTVTIPAAGFGGGCSSFMMRQIVKKIIKNEQCMTIENAGVQPYRNLLKGSFGNVSLLAATPTSLREYYPTAFLSVPVEGFIVTSIDPDFSILNRPICGDAINENDIIVGMSTNNHNWITVGTRHPQRCIGPILWSYNPEDKRKLYIKYIKNPEEYPDDGTLVSVFVVDKSYTLAEYSPDVNIIQTAAPKTKVQPKK